MQQSVHNHSKLLARIVTFGKAFAAHGAVILGSTILKHYLINYARPLIYSTALPPHSLAAIEAAYMFMKSDLAKNARQTLWLIRDHFRRKATKLLPDGSLPKAGRCSPIQGVLVPGNKNCVAVASAVRSAGFDVYPIRSPTVPKGKERIRITLHAHNTYSEVNELVTHLARSLVEYRRQSSL